MKSLSFYCTILLTATFIFLIGCNSSDNSSENQENNGWISIWDGETLNNWRASENPDSFEVVDGKIVVDGPRGHLFYEGPVSDANFVNFEFRADVYTYPEANSGVFFHTQYQEEGWPQHGYEAQVNATHRDPRKTGSLYAVKDVMDVAPHNDHEWFHYYIKVDGRDITFKVDGETVMEFTEPEDREGTISLSSGTIALQAHDPNSRIYFKNLYVRVLD
ncbi:MAG: DUF1080 domain-containing protein [Balneolaceae bacterium]|nr:DUF1080 domain-containing protein [Balneolaceae bacterium]